MTCFVIVMILLLGLVAPVAAATIRVATTGQDHAGCGGVQRTLVAGLQCLRPGDTLLIAPGTYAEHDLQVPAGTSEATRTTVRAENPGTVLVVSPGGPGSHSMLGVRAWTTIEGIVIDANYQATNGIDLGDGSHHIRLTDVTITNPNSQGIAIRQGPGYHELRNVQVSGAGYGPRGCVSGAVHPGPGFCHGVYLSAPHVLIDGGSYHHNNGYGMQIYVGNAAHTVVQNTHVYANHSTGIGVFRPDTILTNNRVHDNGGIGIWAKSTGGVLTGNTVQGNTGGGIVTDEGRGYALRGNVTDWLVAGTQNRVEQGAPVGVGLAVPPPPMQVLHPSVAPPPVDGIPARPLVPWQCPASFAQKP